MGSLEHIGQHYSLGEQQLSDDEACHEEDDDDQGGGDVPHAGSNQDIDFSGYVDEYGFMPLTPSLETALTDALSSMEDAGNGSPVTSLTFIEGQMIDEMTELARLGYLNHCQSNQWCSCHPLIPRPSLRLDQPGQSRSKHQWSHPP